MKRRQNSDFKIVSRDSIRAGLIAIGIALSGCAVTTPASIVSTDGELSQSAAIEMAPFEADGSLRAIFGAALRESLGNRAVAAGEPAPMIAEFAISARNAEGGIADPAGSTPSAIVWESLPDKSRWYDECEAIRLRATLVVLNRTDGSIAYRGVAESNVCEYNQADLRALADTLLADAA